MISNASDVRSMTGFGSARTAWKGVDLEVEIKTVNSRFLDVGCRLPRCYAQLEPALREVLAEGLVRGRVELGVNRRSKAGSGPLSFNSELADRLLLIYQQQARKLKLSAGSPEMRALMLVEILRRSEVLGVESIEECSEAEGLRLVELARKAVSQVNSMRLREGRILARELTSGVSRIARLRDSIARSAANAPQVLKGRLEERLKKLAGELNLEPQRIAMEAAVLADRISISEELVRLESHEGQFREILAHPPSGRKLEFILQEMGREVNTIGSKAQDARVQHKVVAIKAELEKLREQVQNIE